MINLTSAQFAIVAGETATGSILSPVSLTTALYVLPTAVITDKTQAKWSDYLGQLPRGSTEGTLVFDGTPARSAQFVNSLCLAGHLNYNDSTQHGDFALTIQHMSSIGIRTLRTAAPYPGSYAVTSSAHNELARAGLKQIMCHQLAQPASNTIAYMTTMAQLWPGCIAAIEGPNEVNNDPTVYGGTDHHAAGKLFQANLWATVRAQSTLADIPVILFTDSVGNYSTSYGYSSHANIGAIHPYNTAAGVPQGRTSSELAVMLRVMSPTTAVAITENGYFSLPGFYVFARGVSEEVQAKMGFHVYAEGFYQGLAMTAWYQFLDAYSSDYAGNPEVHWGFYRWPAYTEKPIANYLRNIIATLGDTSTNSTGFTLTALPYPVTIAGAPNKSRGLAFQNSSGQNFLMLWRTEEYWDNSSTAAVDIGSKKCRIEMPYASSLSVYECYSSTGVAVTSISSDGRFSWDRSVAIIKIGPPTETVGRIRSAASATGTVGLDGFGSTLAGGYVELLSGTVPGAISSCSTGVLLASMTMSASAFYASFDDGVGQFMIAKAITSSTGLASGTVGHWRAYTSTGLCRLQGSAGATQTLIMPAYTVTAGQGIRLSSWLIQSSSGVGIAPALGNGAFLDTPSSMRGSGAAYEAEMAAIFAVMSSLGSTLKDAMNIFVKTMKGVGIWPTKLDAFWFTAMNSSTNAQYNWINPTSSAMFLTPIGSSSPNFVAFRGFTGAAGKMFDTGIALNATTLKYQVGAAHVGGYIITAPTTGVQSHILSVRDTLTNRTLVGRGGTTGQGFHEINGNAGQFPAFTGAFSGHIVSVRHSTTVIEFFMDATSTGTGISVATLAPSINLYFLGRNLTGSGDLPFDGQAAAGHVGGDLSTADIANFTSALHTLTVAVGAAT